MNEKLSREAVFFDVDDTVYDHLTPFRQAVKSCTAHIEHFPYEAAYHRMRYYSDMLSDELGGAGVMEQGDSTESMRRRRFQLALQEFEVQITDQEAERVQQAYLSCQFDIQCFAGMKELIIELQQKGIVVGLLTNGAEGHQWRKIRALGLDQLIAKPYIFISGTHGIDKPDPRIFQLINEQTETLHKHCTYVGDSWRNDVVGANRADWKMIWFNHRRQQCGHELQLYREVSTVADLRACLL
jgi:putative hydrolase of the HAD superfamily